jgi:hypothetical protein
MTDSSSAPDLTFEAAIAQAQGLLERLAQTERPELELEQEIAQLVQTQAGARGFFVTYLSDERAIADQPSSEVIAALQSAPDIVAELLVKNVAMSSAMAIAHRRNQDETLTQGSDRVRARSLTLIQHLHSPQISERAIALHESALTGIGAYQAFLDRWGYDAEQRQAIAVAMTEIHPEINTEK